MHKLFAGAKFPRDHFKCSGPGPLDSGFDKSLYEQSLDTDFALVLHEDGRWNFRFSEVIAAGAIPVVIADGPTLPFEQLIDWTAALVRIEEATIARMQTPDELLALLPTGVVMQRMRETVYKISVVHFHGVQARAMQKLALVEAVRLELSRRWMSSRTITSDGIEQKQAGVQQEIHRRDVHLKPDGQGQARPDPVDDSVNNTWPFWRSFYVNMDGPISQAREEKLMSSLRIARLPAERWNASKFVVSQAHALSLPRELLPVWAQPPREVDENAARNLQRTLSITEAHTALMEHIFKSVSAENAPNGSLVLALEDDVVLAPTFKADVAAALAKLPADWDIAKISCHSLHKAHPALRHGEGTIFRIGWNTFEARADCVKTKLNHKRHCTYCGGFYGELLCTTEES